MIQNYTSLVKSKLLAATVFLLSISTFTTFTYIPSEFKTAGGSCYQGISVLMTNAVMIFCLGLFSLSFVLTFLRRHEISVLISVISVIFWLLWAIANSVNQFIDGLLYFSFFAVAGFFNLYYHIQVRKIIIFSSL